MLDFYIFLDIFSKIFIFTTNLHSFDLNKSDFQFLKILIQTPFKYIVYKVYKYIYFGFYVWNLVENNY